jgi:hypothetical protein
VPPLKEVVVESATDWPLSMVVGETEITGAVRAEFTVTATALEATVTGVPELSVTRSSNSQVPVAVRVPVETVGVSLVVQLNELPRPL